LIHIFCQLSQGEVVEADDPAPVEFFQGDGMIHEEPSPVDDVIDTLGKVSNMQGFMLCVLVLRLADVNPLSTSELQMRCPSEQNLSDLKYLYKITLEKWDGDFCIPPPKHSTLYSEWYKQFKDGAFNASNKMFEEVAGNYILSCIF
jgi:hypothetical protein